MAQLAAHAELETKVAPHPSISSEHTQAPAYHGTGSSVHRLITPGGHPVDSSQPAFPVFHRKFGNPSPLGLFSFGATTLVLSLFNLQARGVVQPNAILGMSFCYAGIGQTLVGIQEWACGNTFAATVFASYGGFWFTYSFLFIPQFEVAASYASAADFDNALGIVLVIWGVVTVLFAICAHRSSVALLSLLVNLFITFFCLGAGYMVQSEKCIKAGGAFGIVAALSGLYAGMAGMLTPDTSFFLLPVGDLTRTG